MASMFSKPKTPNTPWSLQPMAFDLPVFPGAGGAAPLPQIPTLEIPQAMPVQPFQSQGTNNNSANILQQLLQGYRAA